jgi:hypothetical protein
VSPPVLSSFTLTISYLRGCPAPTDDRENSSAQMAIRPDSEPSVVGAPAMVARAARRVLRAGRDHLGQALGRIEPLASAMSFMEGAASRTAGGIARAPSA